MSVDTPFGFVSRRSTLAAWIAILATLPACSDGVTGPGAQAFDARAAAEAARSALPDQEENSDLYTNLELVSAELSGASPAAAVASGLPQVTALFRGEGTTQVVSPAALSLLAEAAEEDPDGRDVSLSLLLPESLVGSTLVWDPESERYVVSETRDDAPEDGVRFVMYAVNPATRKPALPLNELGYVDLIDESTDDSSLRLRVRAVDTSGDEPVTLLDYVIGGEVVLSGETRLSAEAEGFVSDGTDRLDFLLTQEIVLSSDTDTATGTTSYALSVPDSEVALDLDMEGVFDLADGEPTSFDLGLTVTDGTSEIVLDAAVDAEQAMDGTVSFDGETVVVIGGTVEEPTFTRPDGSELSEEEKEALRELVEAVQDIIDFADSIFGLFQAT